MKTVPGFFLRYSILIHLKAGVNHPCFTHSAGQIFTGYLPLSASPLRECFAYPILFQTKLSSPLIATKYFSIVCFRPILLKNYLNFALT